MGKKNRLKNIEHFSLSPSDEEKRKVEEWVDEIDREMKKNKKKPEFIIIPVTEEEQKEADEIIAEFQRKIWEEGVVEVELSPGKNDFPIGLEWRDD